MLGLYMELWLSGAVTPARRSDDPRPHLRMTTLFRLGNFCRKKLPIYYFPGPPDVGAIQGAVLCGAVTPARSDDPRHYVKITTIFILGSVCEEIFPIH